MSSYFIDYSEPLKAGFTIPAGGFNGPGGASSNTSLRLYGRGALEWGEAVNEDLVRLTENFASASPPHNPSSGQLWAETKLYHFNTVGGTYHRYDPDNAAWDVAALTVTAVGSLPTTAAIGDYVVFGGALYGYYIKSPIPTAVWLNRAFSTSAAAPIIGSKPEQSVKVYNKFTNEWIPPQSVTVNTAQPTAPTVGSLWFDTSGTGVLKVWGGVPTPTWRAITISGGVTTGNLDMVGLYRVVNMAYPTNPFDAATKQYVDVNFVALNSPNSLTGALTLSGTESLTTQAASRGYVATQIASALGGGGASASVFVGAGPHVYSDGAIAIAGGKIYIALAAGNSIVPGGNWKQVWPATYS